MDRRTFFGTCVGALGLAHAARAADWLASHSSWSFEDRPASAEGYGGQPSPASMSEGWRTFEVTTTVDVQGAAGPTRVWLPLVQQFEGFQRVFRQIWKGNAPVMRALREDVPNTGILFAEWPADWARGKPASESIPSVTLTLIVATRDRATNWSDRTPRGAASEALQRYLQPTKLIPVDGIVRDTALRITKKETDDVAKARAIYEWIVENTERDPKVRGCGLGDVRAMLETRNLRGKCADLNALFVGLARAAGIPARDIYGLRVAPARSFKSLGVSGAVTSAQHCRAEFHSARYGWVPVDPADVRKVILEEKQGLTLASPEVGYARRQLFGSWEMNWIAFNDAHDVALPNSSGPTLPFFMYPQAETGGKRLDSLDPARFRYQITAREVPMPS